MKPFVWLTLPQVGGFTPRASGFMAALRDCATKACLKVPLPGRKPGRLRSQRYGV